MRGRHRSRGRRLAVVSLLASTVAVLAVVLLRHDSSAGDDEAASPAAGVPTVSRGTTSSPDAAVAPARVGQQAPSQVPPRRPKTVGLPSGTSLPVDTVATGDDGVLDLPTDIRRAGWWDGGARIGEPFGTIVLAAHVDSVTDGVGPFAELLRTRPGQRIRLAGSDATQLFEIVSARLTPRASLSEKASIFSVRGPLRLVLITCAGPFDAERGGYRDNLVVVASPLGPPRVAGG